MKIRTGLLFLMAGAFMGLATAPSYAAPTPLDGARSAQADGAGANVVMTGEESSPFVHTALPHIRLHSGTPSGTFMIAGAATQPAAEPLLEAPAGDGTIVFFNSQFNNRKIPREWRQRRGEWSIVKNKAGEYDYLASFGLPDISSSIVFNEIFSDFVFKVKMSRRSSDNKRPSRIIVRARGPLIESGQFEGHFENAYEFNITRKGTFAVFKFVDGIEHRVKDWTPSDAIMKGNRFNELRVRAKGEQLSFRINGVRVWHGTDSSLKTGRVGVGFYNHPDSTGNELRVDWAILETFVDEPSQAADEPAEMRMDQNDVRPQLDGGTADESP